MFILHFKRTEKRLSCFSFDIIIISIIGRWANELVDETENSGRRFNYTSSYYKSCKDARIIIS